VLTELTGFEVVATTVPAASARANAISAIAIFMINLSCR
jgi:hypothetical protein